MLIDPRQVSKFALYDSYFPAFRASVVEGNARGVMCSYNAVNGVPTCASGDLVKARLCAAPPLSPI